MDKATSRFRIWMMFTTMGLAVLGSIVAIKAGKKDRAAHVNSLPQQNRARHAKVKEREEAKKLKDKK